MHVSSSRVRPVTLYQHAPALFSWTSPHLRRAGNGCNGPGVGTQPGQGRCDREMGVTRPGEGGGGTDLGDGRGRPWTGVWRAGRRRRRRGGGVLTWVTAEGDPGRVFGERAEDVVVGGGGGTDLGHGLGRPWTGVWKGGRRCRGGGGVLTWVTA